MDADRSGNPDSSQSTDQFAGVARAGQAVDRALRSVISAVSPGVTVGACEAVAVEALAEFGASSSMLGYDDGLDGGVFSRAIGFSINNEILCCPDPERVVAPGDLVTVDVAAVVGGWHADAAVSRVVGHGPSRAALASAAARVTEVGVGGCSDGVPWSVVAECMLREAERLGVCLMRGFDGHGVGAAMHQDPRLAMHPADLFRMEDPGLVLRAGMILAIEPVICVGLEDPGIEQRGWLERTSDGRDACFEERTVGVGRDGARVLAGSGVPSIGASD